MADDSRTSGATLTAAEKLARESVDRMLGRLSVEQRLKAGFGFADRAARELAPSFLEASGMAPAAVELRALPGISDEASGRAAHELVSSWRVKFEAQRKAEEQAAGRFDPASASARAEQALSYAAESLRGAVGDGGLKAKVTVGQPIPAAGIKKEAVDVGVQGAQLASRYAVLLAGMGGAEAGAAEELRHKQDIQAILKARRI